MAPFLKQYSQDSDVLLLPGHTLREDRNQELRCYGTVEASDRHPALRVRFIWSGIAHLP